MKKIIQYNTFFKCHLQHLIQYVLIFFFRFFFNQELSSCCITRNNGVGKEASVRELLLPIPNSLSLFLSLLISNRVKKVEEWLRKWNRERERLFSSLSI